MDGATTEGVIVEKLSDKCDSCGENRLLTRLRSDGAFVDDVSSESGGSSEGSMPSSSYEANEIGNPRCLLSCNMLLPRKGNRPQMPVLEMTEVQRS